jgi:hypothetical protein
MQVDEIQASFDSIKSKLDALERNMNADFDRQKEMNRQRSAELLAAIDVVFAPKGPSCKK